MRKKHTEMNLGRSLIKDRFGKKKQSNNNEIHHLHSIENKDGFNWSFSMKNLLSYQSITQETSFQELFSSSELVCQKFQTEKLNIKFSDTKKEITFKAKYFESEILKRKDEILKIPRRPKWEKTMTTQELEIQEKKQFLEWKKELATLNEICGFTVTPYEKNLEFWKQLWRVIERSDIIVQIVDARNPLLFHCEDLEKFVKELDPNKTNILLINKADFLTKAQRTIWAEYFSNINVHIAFFSATLASPKLNMKVNLKNNSDLEEENNLQAISKISDVTNEFESTENNFYNVTNILNRNGLISLFKSIQIIKNYKNPVTIGFVGYPNVGKSSIINALFMKKKVSISKTPGKTKHFQTLYLNKDIILCDSPGVVMPSIINTKAEMILSGILPINQIQDYISPMNLLGTLIPRNIIEKVYGIIIPITVQEENINEPPTGIEILNAHGYNRGFMTQKGQPDNARSARYILNDFINGKLLYCKAPPHYNQNKFHPIISTNNGFIFDSSKLLIHNTITQVDRTAIENLDNMFFQKNLQLKSTVNSTIESTSNNTEKTFKVNKRCIKKFHDKSRKIYICIDKNEKNV